MSIKSNGPNLITDLKIVEIGAGLAGAVCGQTFVEAGARVTRGPLSVGEPDNPKLLGEFWTVVNDGKDLTADDAVVSARLAEADLVVVDPTPSGATVAQELISRVRTLNPSSLIVAITPFGLTGPHADYTGGDLVSFHSSGMGRLLTGQVENLEAEPPVRAAGQQSAFIAGTTAACAAMLAMSGPGFADGELIDVSTQEALACMAIRELAVPAYGRPSQSRLLDGDGNGSTVSIIPAADGFVAISPREERQWKAWLGVMGDPDWGVDERFATKSARAENWNELHALISDWSRQHAKQWIYETAQEAHVPSFPLMTPSELLSSEQLKHRGFFVPIQHAGRKKSRPGAPYRVSRGKTADGTARSRTPGASGPLQGVNVLDLSWVIAGPTCTRYLAAMGANVIKVETTGRSDPGRASELHAVLGQSKRAITLDLKNPDALSVAHRLVERCDVVVENFATGVLERLGLGYESLVEIKPDIILLSASGLGRTGPDASRVAYGTLIQCYTGFAAMNGYPGVPPRVGWAWADPLCGLKMAFAVGAALRNRSRTGEGGHIDFSMVEALLTTMPEPILLETDPEPTGNAGPHFRSEASGVYPCAGDDNWVAIDSLWSNEVFRTVPGLEALSELETEDGSLDFSTIDLNQLSAEFIDPKISAWTRQRSAAEVTRILQDAGVSAAPSPDSTELFNDAHLRERGFYADVDDMDGQRRALPGLPWRWTAGERSDPFVAREIGADTEAVLESVLGMSESEIETLRDSGALS